MARGSPAHWVLERADSLLSPPTKLELPLASSLPTELLVLMEVTEPTLRRDTTDAALEQELLFAHAPPAPRVPLCAEQRSGGSSLPVVDWRWRSSNSTETRRPVPRDSSATRKAEPL